MAKLRRVFTIALAALVLFAILASFLVILGETDHDCTGEDCPICAAVAACWKTLERLAKLLAVVAVCAVAVLATVCGAPAFCRFLRKTTPVSLSVKLLN